MGATKVGVREFRENLSAYLESSKPVHVTRHGTTIGIYVPTPRPPASRADLEALRLAGEKLDESIQAAGTSEDELLKDFRHRRKSGIKQRAK
jgi:antitoxin (DNA-binding transcriptional repressor) of toxin-antitoxin stability system